MVCVFALLHVVHSVSSCPFLLVTWLHKACLIFISFYHGFPRLRSWLDMNVALLRRMSSRGLFFMSSPTLSLSSLCCNVFSSMMMLKYRNKVLYRSSRLFWTLYSSMIYQYAAEGQHQTAIVYFLIEIVSSAKFLAYIYALNNAINEEVVLHLAM